MKGRKEYICLVIWILSIVIPLMYRHYTLFEIICYSFFSLFLVIGATIDKLYFILPDEGAIALTIIGILYSIVEQHAVFDTCVHVLIVASISIALRILSRGGLGWGDIKWMSAISIWLTNIQIIVMIYVSCFASTLYLASLYSIRNTVDGIFLLALSYALVHGVLCILLNVWEAIYWSVIKHIIVMALY